MPLASSRRVSRVASPAFHQHAVFRRIAQPGAEHALAHGPSRLARGEVEGQHPPCHHGALAVAGQVLGIGLAVQHEQLAAPAHDGVVAEAVPRLHAPQRLAAAPIQDGQPRARLLASELALLAPGLRRGPSPADDAVPDDGEEGPGGRRRLAGQGGQGVALGHLAGGGIEAQALAAIGDIDAVRQRDVIAADGVGPRLMGGVVVDRAQAGQRRFPQEPARVHVDGAQAIRAFDDQPALDGLRRRAVPWRGRMP